MIIPKFFGLNLTNVSIIASPIIISFTKLEDVYKRSLQAAKKGKTLTFNCRCGYFTKDLIKDILDQIRKVGDERNLKPLVSLNCAQAVVCVRYQEAEYQEEVFIEDANEGEKYDSGE